MKVLHIQSVSLTKREYSRVKHTLALFYLMDVFTLTNYLRHYLTAFLDYNTMTVSILLYVVKKVELH